MGTIEDLARAIALRDIKKDIAPANSIAEMGTVLAVLTLEAYEKIYPEELNAARGNRILDDGRGGSEGSTISGPSVEAKNLGVVSDERRAELVVSLNQAANEAGWVSAGDPHEIARALTAPTVRELNLDELLHSRYVKMLLEFAERTGKDSAPVVAREIRDWMERI